LNPGTRRLLPASLPGLPRAPYKRLGFLVFPPLGVAFGTSLMIVACPECSSRFRVPEDALGAGGRYVRCGNCGHSWVQKPRQAILEVNHRFPRTEKRLKKDEPGAAIPAPSSAARSAGRGLLDIAQEEMAPSFAAPPPPPPPRMAPPPPPPPAAMPEPDLAPPVEEAPSLEALAETVAESVEPADDMLRRRGPPRPKPAEAPKRSIAAAIGWILLLVTIVGLGLAVQMRADVVAAFPQSRAIYQAFRLDVPAPGAGLTVTVQPPMRGSSAGTPTMEVSGKLRNASASSQSVPILRVSLIDEKGVSVADRDLTLDATQLESGEETAFTVVFENPPAAAQNLVITLHDRPGAGLSLPSWLTGLF
jgi:predicted Zn finger-like uncharacterized protein